MAAETVAVPGYLKDVYWWAYVHPRAVHVFEREWLVNLILWGNFGRLRDAALHALAAEGRATLQIACVYGDLTQRLSARAPSRLDVVDVLTVQLQNLARKLAHGSAVGLHQADSARLPFDSAAYERALLFFLLHEQPAEVRRRTLEEAVRVLRPGGRLVIVDYHRPARSHLLYWPMQVVLKALEPFAMDLWQHELAEWLPSGVRTKRTLFGGLYQIVVFEKGLS